MEKEKNNTTIVLFILLVVVLAIICVLFATGIVGFKEKNVNITNVSSNNNVLGGSKKSLTFSDIQGKYVAEYTDKNNDKIEIELNLYENGIFAYSYNQSSYLGGKPRDIGNYTISDDKITLHCLFGTRGDPTLYLTECEKTISINNDLISANIDNNSLKFTKDGLVDSFDFREQLKMSLVDIEKKDTIIK